MIQNKTSQGINNQRGNLLIVISVLIGVFFMAMALIGYLRINSQTLKNVTLKQKVHEHVLKIVSKTKDYIIKNDLSTCSFDFGQLKDASRPTMAEIATGSYTVPSKTFSASEVATCFFDPHDDVGLYSTIMVTVSRAPRDSDPLISGTMVEIQIQYSTATSPVMADQLNYQLVINLVSSMNFAAIFRGTANLITVRDGSSLYISGKTLVSNGTATLDLSSMDTNVYFQDTLFATGPQVSYGTNMSFNVDSDLLKNFTGGIQTNSFKSVQGGGGFSFDQSSIPWQQPLDYQYVYNNTGGFPLPAGSAVGLNAGGTPVYPVSAGNLNLRRFPENSMSLRSLDQTCSNSLITAGQGSIPNMVLLRIQEDLTLDFTAGSTGQTSSLFCGLIAARNLTVKLNTGLTAAIYGHINVGSLSVTGGGSLYIVDPFDYVTLPSGSAQIQPVSIQNLVNNYLTLKAAIAHNFFSPFGTGVPQAFAPNMFSDYLIDCKSSGAPSGTYCWKQSVQSADPAATDSTGNSYLPTSLYNSSVWYKSLSFLATVAL